MTKSRNRYKKRVMWTEADTELLRRNYADSLTSDLALALGRPVDRVLAKAHALGLHKSAAHRTELARQVIQRPGHAAQATRFPKGHVPANKGLKRPPGWSPGAMAQHQFKPGRKPHTWVPVGALRLKDGYLERKISELPGSPSRRWHGVHRLVWEAVHGPTPSGHVVVFKPGRHSTDLAAITLDAVELVSRADLMRRNTRHNYGPQINEVITLRAAISRQVNKRSKESSPS